MIEIFLFDVCFWVHIYDLHAGFFQREEWSIVG